MTTIQELENKVQQLEGRIRELEEMYTAIRNIAHYQLSSLGEARGELVNMCEYILDPSADYLKKEFDRGWE